MSQPAALDRTFHFEDDFVAQMRCIPMAVRRKLDLCGLKLKLAHWTRLPAEARNHLLRLAVIDAAGLAAYRDFLLRQLDRDGQPPPGSLAVPDRFEWQMGTVPPALRDLAQSHGVPLDDSTWHALDELQRFALVKLGRASHESENFAHALREFGLLK